MVNSILIGQAIKQILSENSDLANYVENRIFPLVVDEDVNFPFVVFYRNSISTNSDKANFYEDVVNFNVMAVAETYKESCQIANEIRKSLEFKKRTFQDLGIFIYDSKLTSCTENYIANNYVQTLTFSCVVH